MQRLHSIRVRDALQQARQKLQVSGVDEPGFEAEYLLRHTLACTRETLLLGLDDALHPNPHAQFESLVARRALGEPSAYITGHREFYGLDFKVDPRALIPRPETELLVEFALDFASLRSTGGKGLTIVDVGTGCGAIAIAIAIALNLAQATVIAADISPEALGLARENIARHGVQDRTRLLHGDLLDPIPPRIDILLSNPPYIPSPEIPGLAPEISRHEPRLALDGGPDGMAVIERLIRQARDKLAPGGAMFVEIGWDQGPRVTAQTQTLWPDAHASITPDLAGLDRVLTIKSPVPAPIPA